MDSTVPESLGDSVTPGSLCPGGAFDYYNVPQATQWKSIYLPKVVARVNKYISGNLNLTTADVALFFDLCGYESQISGRLSPWCSAMTEEEFEDYQYGMDLYYWYTNGPGAGKPLAVNLPFVKRVVDLLAQGPGIKGVDQNGNAFDVPDLLMTFALDVNVNNIVGLAGVFDNEKPLPPNARSKNYNFVSSRITPMRGTVAFERLTCSPDAGFCKDKGKVKGKRAAPTSSSSASAAANGTYIRILLNDAVYPVANCQDGPGRSCSMEKYVKYISDKYAAFGNYKALCNATSNTAAPDVVLGASFFTDLRESWLGFLWA